VDPTHDWTLLDSLSFAVIILCHFTTLFFLVTSGACL